MNNQGVRPIRLQEYNKTTKRFETIFQREWPKDKIRTLIPDEVLQDEFQMSYIDDIMSRDRPVVEKTDWKYLIAGIIFAAAFVYLVIQYVHQTLSF